MEGNLRGKIKLRQLSGSVQKQGAATEQAAELRQSKAVSQKMTMKINYCLMFQKVPKICGCQTHRTQNT